MWRHWSVCSLVSTPDLASQAPPPDAKAKWINNLVFGMALSHGWRNARLNGVEPLAWLTDVLERMVSGRVKATELERLLSWNWKLG